MELTDVEPFPRDREVNRRWAPAKIGAVTSVTVIGLLAAWQITGMLDRWDARNVAACQQSSPPQACYPMHVPWIAIAVWGLIGAVLIYGPVGRPSSRTLFVLGCGAVGGLLALATALAGGALLMAGSPDPAGVSAYSAAYLWSATAGVTGGVALASIETKQRGGAGDRGLGRLTQPTTLSNPSG